MGEKVIVSLNVSNKEADLSTVIDVLGKVVGVSYDFKSQSISSMVYIYEIIPDNANNSIKVTSNQINKDPSKMQSFEC